VTAVESQAAAAGCKQAGDQIEHRGLARAVGPDEPEDGALGNGDVHVLQHMQAAEALRHGIERQHQALLFDAALRLRSRAGSQMPRGRNSTIRTRMMPLAISRKSAKPRRTSGSSVRIRLPAMGPPRLLMPPR